jgi:shikimate kinase
MAFPLATPYRNLILTGHIGVGRVTLGRLIARMTNVPFVDLNTELQLREGRPAEELRALYGETRLKRLEEELCREFGLRRGSVLSIDGPTLLDENNRGRLLDSGPVLILTCGLNEILRRLHVSQGAHFHDPKARSAALHLIRRERQIEQITGIPTLDTTTLSLEQVAEHAIRFWRENDVKDT